MAEIDVPVSALNAVDEMVVVRSGTLANVAVKDGATKAVGATVADLAAGNRGIPTGGTAGQALVKTSGTDYAVNWGAVAGGGSSLPAGGTTGQALLKTSGADYAAAWGGVVHETDIGGTVQAWKAVLDATTASFTTAEKTKLTAAPAAPLFDELASAPQSFQDAVGLGNLAFVEAGTGILKGAAFVDVAGAPVGSWVARVGDDGWEFPTDAQMFALGEAANPLAFDPTALVLTSNIATYAFATYRKVKTAAPAAATSIAASTLAAVQPRWVGGAMIKFPMGATGYAITPAGTGYVEHGRPTTWVANNDYIALILRFDVPHVFWLAPGVRH